MIQGAQVFNVQLSEPCRQCQSCNFSLLPCSMLGLGDIVIPGIFVALLLRYDQTHNKGSTAYFYRCVMPLRHDILSGAWNC